jgi:hypothetical protein
MISFVDLPSIGTPSFPDLQSYCEHINLKNYSLVVILTATRFTQLQLDFAGKVNSIGKPWFFVRTKIDIDCRAERRRNNFDEKRVLKAIKDDCMQHLHEFVQSEDQFFLISSFDRDKWDFECLVSAIYAELPDDQREVLIHHFNSKARGKIVYCLYIF